MKLILIIVDAHDKNRIQRDVDASKHIGEIRVTVFRKQAKEDIYDKATGTGGNTNLEISEKAVKGQSLSHGTEYVPMHIRRGFGC